MQNVSRELFLVVLLFREKNQNAKSVLRIALQRQYNQHSSQKLSKRQRIFAKIADAKMEDAYHQKVEKSTLADVLLDLVVDSATKVLIVLANF